MRSLYRHLGLFTKIELFSDIDGGFARIEIGFGASLDWGDGNIVVDPTFVDPTIGNFRLSPESPCIDADDPSFMPRPRETDLDGHTRVWGGRVDMGAFEHGSFTFGDMNCDNEINAFDIEPFILALFNPQEYEAAFPNCDRNLADLNGDNAVDAFDIEPFIEALFP